MRLAQEPLVLRLVGDDQIRPVDSDADIPGVHGLPGKKVLAEVAGQRKAVPPDHPMITTARLVGTCLGDEIPNI